jgi:hypothetical protein
MLNVLAGDLAKALSGAKARANAKKQRPLIVSLEYRVDTGTLPVIEAKHAVFASSIDAEGVSSAPFSSAAGPSTSTHRLGHRKRGSNWQLTLSMSS